MDITTVINGSHSNTGNEKKEINREKLHNLVSLIYQPVYKTFYVNSHDGVSIIKPYGIFVSLGITTSKRTMEEVRQQIAAHGYETSLAEISSIKDGATGQFINTLIGDKEPSQYPVTDYDPDSVLDEEAANKELEELKSILAAEKNMEILKRTSLKVSRLTDLLQKLNVSGWTNHFIQKIDDGNDYRIFHKYVNYKKEGDIEYRIGIFVS